jgi:hypothetical protein
MTFDEFRKSLTSPDVPVILSDHLKSLWYDAKGDWNKAHSIIQNIEDLPAGRQDRKAAWIHAYLHRKEGDIGNADYWYRMADKKRPDVKLEEEWETIVKAFL